MKKALIYLRVSDIMQEEKDSLSNQEKQAIEYCNFKKYKVCLLYTSDAADD